MDDELEDKVLYQTFLTHMKLISKFAVGIPSLNTSLSYLWKLLRIYILKPELLICGFLFIIILAYLQALDSWNRNIFGKIQLNLGIFKSTKQSFNVLSIAEKESWEMKKDLSAVYAVQGRRPKMEDRFVIDENINNTGISFFAIFDGHGGEFAADFAKDILVPSVLKKIVESSNIINGKSNENVKHIEINKENVENKENSNQPSNPSRLSLRKTKKTLSMTEDCINNTNCQRTAEENFLILNKLSSFIQPLNCDGSGSGTLDSNNKPHTFDANCYVQNGKINFSKLITDEVLAADYKLIEQAKKSANVAGTTALIAIMQNTTLTVANIGDSRGVMCDLKGNAIPLSFDHKPQLSRERKRIIEAGGYISFKGVWRVAGILATSRALGDYPLKHKNLVIADPDILTFELADHKPNFIILASDGLWDTFSNEEAVAFIKERLEEPHFGAKSIALQSYNRGSVDNITVLVIVFKDGKFKIGSSIGSGGYAPRKRI